MRTFVTQPRALCSVMESWEEVAVEPPVVEVKLFGRWNPDDVQVGDISLQVNTFIAL